MEKKKTFNITGTCIPNRHYMIPPDRKIGQIMRMVEKGEYFTINRPRQYGKTTTLQHLPRYSDQTTRDLTLGEK